MNKRFLPIIASVFILSLVVPVFAQPVLRYAVAPTLVVRTIPEDNEWLKTGVILLGLAGHTNDVDLLASYKIIVTYNGVPVTASNFYCQVAEKDKYNPLKAHQGDWENFVTVVKDRSGDFICKWREGKPGVGVLDVYYIGTKAAQYIADYILIVGVSVTIGRTIVYGTDLQDVCVLGWNAGTAQPVFITKPDGTHHYIFPNALGTWTSCEDAALYQKHYVLGLPVPWT